MREPAVAIVALAGMSLLLVDAQPQEKPVELPLRVRSSVLLAEGSGGFSLPAKCDPRGNVYLRGDDAFGNYLAAPVAKFLPDGKRAALFALESRQGFEPGAAFDDFAIDLRGNVYLLALKVRHGEKDPGRIEDVSTVIVAYDSEGNYSRTIPLNVLLQMGQLAVFPSGEFFVGGETIEETSEGFRVADHTFAGTFDRTGRLMKELTLPDDIEPQLEEQEKSSEGGAEKDSQPSLPKKLPKEEFKKALSLGSVVPGDDGNVYLMRATPSPLVYIIAPSSTVVRRLVIPAPDEHAMPSAHYAAGGRLVVMFGVRDAAGKWKGNVFVVANALTGEVLAHYLEPPGERGTLVCYSPDGFTLLGRKDNRPALIHTYPQ